MQLLFLIVFASLLTFVTPGIIDNYQTVALVVAHQGQTVNSLTQNSNDFIGGERTITSTFTSGALDITASSSAGLFALSSDVSTQGEASALYTGVGASAFVPVQDFSSGCNCWNIRTQVADAFTLFEIEVFNSGTSAVSSYLLDVDLDASDICIPYGGDTSIYGSATALDVRLIGTLTNIDTAISYVCCQPTVDCWHEIVPMATMGDVVTVKYTCTNYNSRPMRDEMIETSFGFDNSLALVQNPSCGPLASNMRIDNNAVKYEATLPAGDSLECTFDLSLVGVGTLNDIGCVIDILSASGPSSMVRSNAGVSRAGTPSFCDPAAASSLMIQAPVTTLSPTEPPTMTLAPTSDPMTNPGRVRASVCIVPNVIAGECSCNVYPCYYLDDGDITCETNERFCLYIQARRFRDGMIRFGYRGADCTCMQL